MAENSWAYVMNLPALQNSLPPPILFLTKRFQGEDHLPGNHLKQLFSGREHAVSAFFFLT